jgi:hypothetical protein
MKRPWATNRRRYKMKISELKEMVKMGNHEEIIAAVRQWNEYRNERFGKASFNEVVVNGSEIVVDGKNLSDDDLGLWIDYCQGITYKDR